jgi:hypothetical protein
MFGGPIAGSYPKQVWPKNNMRIHGAVPPERFPPLESDEEIKKKLKNVRRSKRENLGGWSGGRKRTMRKYRKKRNNRTLKRRHRKK